MGTMQRYKRIQKEQLGLARKKRHGIKRYGEKLWNIRERLIQAHLDSADEEILKALRGEPSTYPVLNMQGVSHQ